MDFSLFLAFPVLVLSLYKVEKERRGEEKEKKNGRCAIALDTPSEHFSSGPFSHPHPLLDSYSVYGALTKRQALFWVLEIEQ